jgi:hypothetical protein
VKREVEKETNKVATGTGPAASSYKALYYNLISPHTIRRLATRLTVGGKKYGIVQWRQGINDAEYVADRFNHLWEHLMDFMANGNATDDNIGGMLWALNCLSEVERLCPDALKHIVGISDVFGAKAIEMHNEEMKKRG